eukprot:109747-Amphidinium_carterae.1
MPPRRVPTGRTARERRFRRRQLGPLRSLVVKPHTLKRYCHALSFFFKWRALRHVSLPPDAASLDLELVGFAEALWEEGDSKTILADSLSGFHHFLPHLRGRLPGAWRMHGAWCQAEMPQRTFPISLPMLGAMVGFAYLHDQPRLATLLALGHHALLRTSELIGVRVRDV